MRKVYLAIMAAVLVTSVLTGCSKGYESKKIVGDMGITLKAERYPLIKGNNTLSVNVADAAGNAVTDSAVNVRYYMPAMPGMAPMEFNAQASPKGSSYAFDANVPMEGGWKVDVAVTRPGKPAVTTTFNVDAR